MTAQLLSAFMDMGDSASKRRRPARKAVAAKSGNARTRTKARTVRTQTTRKRSVSSAAKPARQPFWTNLKLSQRTLRGLWTLATLMVLTGAVMWLYVWINNPAHLSIKRVDWQSEFRYLQKPELQALIEPHVHTNLYLLDEVALEQALEDHPWIRAASLVKAWPDQVLVNIEEQVPIAFWGEGRLLNQFGEIFRLICRRNPVFFR
ncbi:MAG: FtsQ-type POTRA domain-containing protein [Thiolinea sp.]